MGVGKSHRRAEIGVNALLEHHRASGVGEDGHVFCACTGPIRLAYAGIQQTETLLAEKERVLTERVQTESGKAAARLLQFAKLEETIAAVCDIVSAKTKSADDKIKAVNDLLSSSRADIDTREIFEQQFEQAHSQFFKKLYAAHPDLTPGESRMCAYLIMNLSSKEIASITGKTTRSVEATRYRIGKKLTLPEGKSLTIYLRDFL